MITCPNCKEKYEVLPPTEKKYPILMMHSNQTCPFGIEIHHYTLEKAKESAITHIMGKFPWITANHKYLRK